MKAAFFNEIFFALGIVISLGFMSSAENEIQNRSKYKYGYVIAHKGGGTQAHLESRDGDLALGRYYVNLHNGTGQRVTYFADDLGFHTGVSYSSQNEKGSSKTQIAVGQKALAALGNSKVQSNTVVTTANPPNLLFGKKILKAAINAVTPTSVAQTKLNYTPVPKGFYLIRNSDETFGDSTEQPSYNAGLTSQGFSSYEGKYSEEVSQSKANTQTFHPTSENVKNEIKELHIQSTTPSIRSYDSVPQQGFIFSGARDETKQFSRNDRPVKVSTYTTDFGDVSYSKQRSIEKTNFADIDAQIISEVQKHAEQIIMKDLQKSQNVNSKTEYAKFSSSAFQPSTVTMQPIIVTNDGETGFKHTISTTANPEVRKLSKNLQSGTINSVKVTEKNSDQTLENSGYFQVSLSSSLASSINVSQTPHQSINAESTDINSVSNNSTLCGFDLCDKDTKSTFSVDLIDVKPNRPIDSSDSLEPDVSDGSGTNKIVHTFYPENKLHDEKHYITTIDVQKAISLNVNQNEAGNIQLAQNFPFNKIKPFDQIQNQYNAITTPQPLVSNQISVTPNLYAPQSNLNLLSTPREPHVLNTVSASPELFDVKSNQNSAVLQVLNDVASSQIQDRIGNNRLGYENQLVVPPAPIILMNKPTDELGQKQQEDLKQVEKNIQELRQEIISNIDTQHEEEQRKQNLVDEERKQYFENLKKVEALKGQNSISYRVPVKPQANSIQATDSPIFSAENVNNVELLPQNQYVSTPQNQYEEVSQSEYEAAQGSQYEVTPQIQYEQKAQAQYDSPPQSPYDQTLGAQYVPQPQTYQTEIKDFTHEIAVPQPNIQQIPNLEAYQKQILQYNTQDIQTSNGPRQYNLYDTANAYAVDNNIQQSAPTYTTEKIQLNTYVPQLTSVAFQPRYAVSQLAQIEDKSKKTQQLPFFNGQINTISINLAKGTVPQAKAPESKALLFNRVVPFDYSRFLHVKPPLPLLHQMPLPQTYQVPLASETKLTLSEIYPVHQQVPLAVQIPQAYKFVAQPDITSLQNKQYHSTLIQRPNNKLRIQPLKPSSPDEDSQREAVQNLLSQPQFHQTYYYPGLPFSNRLQLRHIGKNQILNSDQVRSQSVIRRGKSLKNLRIEYGFKPPLRPSVEFSEEVKPSIYGPSVPSQ